ncbi:hypothetical protein B2J93_1455 [Marssonina coronariae]|uniref:Uncharacterized protein n=1 Tax=Diplocarpon coronariae TaxID=2795749 RepID=A0A218YW20_9HELO|nr:hypothetical protein B2J93_1455 [Marssonina coronariae]
MHHPIDIQREARAPPFGLAPRIHETPGPRRRSRSLSIALPLLTVSRSANHETLRAERGGVAPLGTKTLPIARHVVAGSRAPSPTNHRCRKLKVELELEPELEKRG